MKHAFTASAQQKRKAETTFAYELRIDELNKKIAELEANDTSPFKKQKIRELRQQIKRFSTK